MDSVDILQTGNVQCNISQNKLLLLIILLQYYPSVDCPSTQWTFSMAGVLERVDWTMSIDNVHRQCPLSPWKLSPESMGIVHGLSGHCPWTQGTISIDSLDIVLSVSGLSPHTLYRGMHSEDAYVRFSL